MTEDEAKTKWCPFVRIGSTMSGKGSLNRDYALGHEISSAGCIASQCMAWRWVEIMARDIPPNIEFHQPGYCGLAGKP